MNWGKQKNNILISLLATFLLLIASISFWFYRDVYNKDSFQSHVSQAINTTESRTALASLVIDRTFQDRPVLKGVLLDQAAPALAGALSGPRIQNIMNRLILQIYNELFSSTPRSITIDLTPIKTFVGNLSQLVETATGEQRQPVNVPDQIMIVRQGEIPSIAPLAQTILLLGPIALIGGLAIAVWLVWRSAEKAKVIEILGGSLAVWFLIAILFSQWYKPLLLSMVHNDYGRIIAEQILNVFLSSFTSQHLLIFLIGILMVIGGIAYQRWYLEIRK